MARKWTVELASGAAVVAPATDPTWVELSDVTQIVADVGQDYTLDQIAPSTATITARYPTGFATPNTLLKVGNQLRIVDKGTGRLQWRGRISNTSVFIEGPQGATAPYDTLTVECVGSLDDWGRTNRVSDKKALGEFLTRVEEVARGNYSSTVLGSTATVGGTYPSGTQYMVALQGHQTQAQFIVRDAGPVPSRTLTEKRQAHLEILMPDTAATASVTFSDAVSSATVQIIERAQLLSATESFFTSATITPLDSTIPAQTSGSGDWEYTASSTAESAALAKSLADWIVNVYGTSPFVVAFGSSPYIVAEMTIRSEAQSTWVGDLGVGLWKTPGYQTTLDARGKIFPLFIIGASMSATPDTSVFTYRVIPADWRNFLILNSASNGALGYYRLGIQ